MRPPIPWLSSVLACTISLAVDAGAGAITGTVTAYGVKDARHIVVYIDRIEGARFAPPAEAASINQRGKEFVPHVLPILKGGKVAFINNDALLHNVHLYLGRKSLANLATPAGAAPVTKTFDQLGEVAVLCDIHPEMSAYILVLETPYAAVTAEDGRYRIPDIPPGSYLLKTWHETLKPVSRAVSLQGEEPVTVDLHLH